MNKTWKQKTRHKIRLLKIALEKAKKENVNLKEALYWCEGSADFGYGGKAQIGWNEICRPLLNFEAGIEGIEHYEK